MQIATLQVKGEHPRTIGSMIQWPMLIAPVELEVELPHQPLSGELNSSLIEGLLGQQEMLT